MKVIDQINGSAIFAQSAYSASIATKDNLGRDITATYLTAHQSLNDYLTTADANTISSTLSGAITALSSEVPQLSGGEGIGISTVDGKTVITNNISAGSNISLVYDMETNTYRIDSTGGSPIEISGYTLTPGNGINFVLDEPNSALYVNANDPADNSLSVLRTQTNCGIGNCSANAGRNSFCQGGLGVGSKSDSLAQGWYAKANTASLAQGYKVLAETNSIAQGKESTAQNCSQTFGVGLHSTNSGMAIGTYNNISTASFVIGNGSDTANKSDIFVIYHDGRVSAAGKISANGVELGAGGGTSFPITGTNGTTAYTNGADCSSFYLSNSVSRGGSVVTFSNNALNFEAYPSTDVSASWYNIINGANNRSNCYCIRFTDDMTAASLEDYSAYDKVTVVHSNQYKSNCVLHWNGYTKTLPSGVYCEMVKGTNDQNQTDWFFTNSGRINNLEWDN